MANESISDLGFHGARTMGNPKRAFAYAVLSLIAMLVALSVVTYFRRGDIMAAIWRNIALAIALSAVAFFTEWRR